MVDLSKGTRHGLRATPCLHSFFRSFVLGKAAEKLVPGVEASATRRDGGPPRQAEKGTHVKDPATFHVFVRGRMPKFQRVCAKGKLPSIGRKAIESETCRYPRLRSAPQPNITSADKSRFAPKSLHHR